MRRFLSLPLAAVLLGAWIHGVATAVLTFPLVYNVIPNPGIDCTGSTDSTTGLQNLINAVPDYSIIHVPMACTLNISSTITVSSRVGLEIVSDIHQRGGNSAPQFLWTGGAAGVMFDFETDDHPRVSGFHFGVNGAGTIASFLKFDGSGGLHTPTAALVEWNDFNASGQQLTSCGNTGVNIYDCYVAISVSPTSTQNHENYYIHDNTVECSQTASNNTQARANDGVVNGTTTLTSATASFVGGDVGQRVRLTYPGTQGGYFQDTTIASVSSGTTAILSVAATKSQSNVQITIGTSFGIAVQIGASQNAKHERIYGLDTTNCDIAINVLGGSVDIRHLGGGFGGWGVYLNSTFALTESSIIEQYEDEGDQRGIEVKGSSAPVSIRNSRVANAYQLSDGFYKLGSYAVLESSGAVSTASCYGSNGNTNSVIVGEEANPVILTSINNAFNCLSAPVGYQYFLYGVTSINDNVGNNANSTLTISNLPTMAPAAHCRLWVNSGIITLTTCP